MLYQQTVQLALSQGLMAGMLALRQSALGKPH